MSPLRFEVLVDWTERPNKCTILPLAGHPALQILRLDRGQAPLGALTGALLLHPDGEPLDQVAKTVAPGARLSAIDCTWKRLAPILGRLPKPWPRLARIPPGFLTAYPRRNKEDLDPAAGLATIEALFIAGLFLGSSDRSLLGRYHFAPRFLELNQPVFARYGLPETF